MIEKTLKEHLSEAGKARWAKASEQEKKEHSDKMNAAKKAKKNLPK